MKVAGRSSEQNLLMPSGKRSMKNGPRDHQRNFPSGLVRGQARKLEMPKLQKERKKVAKKPLQKRNLMKKRKRKKKRRRKKNKNIDLKIAANFDLTAND